MGNFGAQSVIFERKMALVGLMLLAVAEGSTDFHKMSAAAWIFIMSQVPSERFSQDILRNRRYADLDIRGYQLDTVLVDPPRGGLDKATLRLLRGFPDIIYVSCNPVTLAANLERLSRTHDVLSFAAFDHFPYTPFIESVLHLRRRPKPAS